MEKLHFLRMFQSHQLDRYMTGRRDAVIKTVLNIEG